MIPANTTVTCPSCDTEFDIEFDVQEHEIIECDNCDVELMVEDSDLKVVDEDIYESDLDDDEEDEEENPQYPIGEKRSK